VVVIVTMAIMVVMTTVEVVMGVAAMIGVVIEVADLGVLIMEVKIIITKQGGRIFFKM
jgi:hypothetical protein